MTLLPARIWIGYEQRMTQWNSRLVKLYVLVWGILPLVCTYITFIYAHIWWGIPSSMVNRWVVTNYFPCSFPRRTWRVFSLPQPGVLQANCCFLHLPKQSMNNPQLPCLSMLLYLKKTEPAHCLTTSYVTADASVFFVQHEHVIDPKKQFHLVEHCVQWCKSLNGKPNHQYLQRERVKVDND